MPNTYPCADTRCNGRTLVNGTPCPDCQKRIKKAEQEAYDHAKEQARKRWEHCHKAGK